MMEDNVFPKPAVAGVLTDHYVEARLHTDGSTNRERIKALQESLARSVANPVYVLVDPETERELGRHEGAALTASQQAEFVEFLKRPLEADG